MSDRPRSIQGRDVKYVPYDKGNYEYVTNNTTKKFNEGEIAPMVPSDSNRQKSQHNVLDVNENIDREEEMNMMSAMYEGIFREDDDAKTNMKSSDVPGDVATINPQQSCMMGKKGIKEDMERPTVTSERGRGGHN